MPVYEYREWDETRPFEGLDAENLFDTLSEYMMQYGERILRHLDPQDQDLQEMLELLIREGFLSRDSEGNLTVTAKGLGRVQRKALHALFQEMKRDAMGKHDTNMRGPGQVTLDEWRPWRFGDPLANLNLGETMRNAVLRQGPGTPISLEPEDFVVFDTEYQTRCATVVLLDMSGSMNRFGKFYHARKVALALKALVQGAYPGDTIKFVGFYSYASPLSERELLLCTPKRVSLFDDRVHLRVPLDSPPGFVPEHFTNIHAGLRIARAILKKEACQNRQIILITDGEPTAHIDGRDLLLIYPPSRQTLRATLAEARQATREGIRISTFALVEDYFYFNLLNFVRQLARVTRGVAVHCPAEELGRLVLEDFQKGRHRRRPLGG